MCGYNSPTDPITAQRHTLNKLTTDLELSVYLDSYNKVYEVKRNSPERRKSIGSWTMVYDEAVEINLDDMSFFAFFQYEGSPKSYKTKCDRTLIGFYRSTKNRGGCYYMEQTSKNNDISSKTKQENIPNGAKGAPVRKIKSLAMTSYTPIPLQPNYQKSKNLAIVDHQKIVNFINSQKNLSWKANTYDFGQGLTLRQFQNSLFKHKKRRIDPPASIGFTPLKPIFKYFAEVSSLAKNHDLSQFITPARSQGSCGSCYMFATVGMLEARLRIKKLKKSNFQISVQHLLDCTFYSQGCKGGYSYEVLRYLKSFYAVPKTCKQYLARNVKCDHSCHDLPDSEKISVSDYYYVGGYYGATNERNIMQELKDHGPVVTSFEPSPDFSYYKGGVYVPTKKTAWEGFGHHVEKEWQKVDHSVLITGWGETKNGQKFWTVMNSWGKNWGENGTFRIVRGQNVLGIESVCEAAIPYVHSSKKMKTVEQ